MAMPAFHVAPRSFCNNRSIDPQPAVVYSKSYYSKTRESSRITAGAVN